MGCNNFTLSHCHLLPSGFMYFFMRFFIQQIKTIDLNIIFVGFFYDYGNKET